MSGSQREGTPPVREGTPQTGNSGKPLRYRPKGRTPLREPGGKPDEKKGKKDEREVRPVLHQNGGDKP